MSSHVCDFTGIEWIPYSQITNLKKIADKVTWEGTDVVLRSLYQCNDNNYYCVIGCYGITQDPITIEYILILNYAEGLSIGLENIHNNNFIHQDILTSGNIGDLGLSQPANNTLSNNEIYGVIPYIAPEIFKGAAFSKESDIYSFNMIMWELTTGSKSYANIEHNVELIYEIIDGKRPEITNDTPECFANLMRKF
ncbi:kinase-like protein [Rhizophagus irregularis]|nr:kinase-like protein [Rhizophagus irregularis]